jgi:RNA polymerase sigma-70 factor (sigma-E family)
VPVMLAAGAPACQLWIRRVWRGAGLVASAEEFVEFAEVMFPRLRRTAFLLCGDWHTAEDLAQTALAKMFVAWREIRRQDGVHAYANRTLVNSYLAHRRLKRTGELLTGWFPDRPAVAAAPETRMVVLDALATLPPRARAVVVLRYWSDLSVEQVADVLNCSTGNVKSLSARALPRLRAVLAEALAEPGPPSRPTLAQHHRGGGRDE